MRAIFSLLGISSMKKADGGLRHGVICELLGNAGSSGDLRIKSVERLATKFSVDAVHGKRVGKVATQLFRQLGADLPPSDDRNEERLVRKLNWRHNCMKLAVTFHTASTTSMEPTYSTTQTLWVSLPEMHRLSLLVLGHRGKLRKLEQAMEDDTLLMQLAALRLAVILCHARRDPDLGGMSLKRPKPAGPVVAPDLPPRLGSGLSSISPSAA